MAMVAAIIPGARASDIPDCDHMRAVDDRTYKEGIEAFLKQRSTMRLLKRAPLRPLLNVALP